MFHHCATYTTIIKKDPLSSISSNTLVALNRLAQISRGATLLNVKSPTIGLATKRLRILSLGGIDKIRNHLVANPIDLTTSVSFREMFPRFREFKCNVSVHEDLTRE